MNRKDIIFFPAVIFSIAIMFGTSDAQSPSSTTFYEIGYDPLEADSQAFFKNELNSQIYEGFLNCGIQFKFYPCSNVKIVNGKVTCPNGENECDLDRMFACVTKLNECDMKSIGKFVIAMFNSGNQISSAQNQATSSGLKNWGDIEKCIKSPDGEKYCQQYRKQLDQDIGSGTPGLETHFKDSVCKDIKEAHSNCPICGGNASGGGAHGGGAHGGGGH